MRWGRATVVVLVAAAAALFTLAVALPARGPALTAAVAGSLLVFTAAHLTIRR